MKKASSMVACRRGGCRRHLRLGRAAFISRARAAAVYHFPAREISCRLNAQLPLPILSSPLATASKLSRVSFCLPLTRDTVLAAVPWLRSSAKARH
jgi:hypothetical protein